MSYSPFASNPGRRILASGPVANGVMKVQNDVKLQLRNPGRAKFLLKNPPVHRIERLTGVDGEGDPSLACRGQFAGMPALP